MNCQSARPHFSGLLDPRVATASTAEVRSHVAGCAECQRELAGLQQTLNELDALPAMKPSPALRANFYAMLAQEKRAQRSAAPASFAHQTRSAEIPLTRRLWFWLVQPVAACALLAAGFMIGQRNSPVPVTTQPVADPATQRELAELRAKVDGMSQLVSYSLNRGSTNDRLQNVISTQSAKVDDRVLTNLINTLALDASTNVRLSALEALYAHADRDVVRAAVLASLSREPSPLVQVAMIDFLVSARDQEASPELLRLVNTETADLSVRDAARRALTQL